MIKIENLSKSYGNSEIKAIDNISLHIKKGEIFGFLGPNGAGKSTTIKCITGILPFVEGKIEICGFDLKTNPMNAKRQFGYIPDQHNMYDGLTGMQYINFIADVFNVPISERKERIQKYGDIFELTSKLSDSISSYSHGMKQKISLISSLVHNPQVLILDEPMTGLDPEATFNLKTIMSDMANEGKTIFFSSHVLDVVEKICTRVAIIDKGKIITEFNMKDLKNKQSDMSLEETFLKLTAKQEGI